MKRLSVILLCLFIAVSVMGCVKKGSVRNTIEGNFRSYSQMNDGTWMCDDHIYKYRLEISGRMPNAARDTSFVYLSNIEEISFEQAYKAAGINSYSGDYFSAEDAVLVEMN